MCRPSTGTPARAPCKPWPQGSQNAPKAFRRTTEMTRQCDCPCPSRPAPTGTLPVGGAIFYASTPLGMSSSSFSAGMLLYDTTRNLRLRANRAVYLIAVLCHLVTLRLGLPGNRRIALKGSPYSVKRNWDVILLEEPHDPPDCGTRAVIRLRLGCWVSQPDGRLQLDGTVSTPGAASEDGSLQGGGTRSGQSRLARRRLPRCAPRLPQSSERLDIGHIEALRAASSRGPDEGPCERLAVWSGWYINDMGSFPHTLFLRLKKCVLWSWCQQ